MKKLYLYIAAFALTFGISSCEDMLDTESLSTDNLEKMTSTAENARKMIDHVYSYFCEDTYTSRMSTNWMQNTDIEVGFLTKANTEEASRRGIWSLNAHQFSDIKNFYLSDEDDPNAIEHLLSKQSVTFRANTVVLPSDAVKTLKVYTLDGVEVKVQVQKTDDVISVDLNGLEKGTYLISTGNSSLKVWKK